MILAAVSQGTLSLLTMIVISVGTAVAVYIGGGPLLALMRRQEEMYDTVLRRQLLMTISPRSAMIVTVCIIVLLGGLGRLVDPFVAPLLGVLLGVFAPSLLMKSLRKRRLTKLEDQLVSGVQTLASGVRAGLNLVQSMGLVARDGPVPLRQEFAHLLQEYEFGLGLEDAMNNSVERIGSGNFRLLFTALQTHRERGGNLGDTLDRIAESIREIQRLEKRVESLTAQGRATARAMGLMPGVVLAIIYFLISKEGVTALFHDPLGKALLLAILVLNVIGFLWIRKIVAVDI